MGFTSRSYSQGININEIIQAGGQDMNIYVGHYISPFMEAFGTGINAGWYNTAQTHEKLGFDISFTANIVVVPEENRLFTFLESDYSNLKLNSGATTAELPTLMGPKGTRVHAKSCRPDRYRRGLWSQRQCPHEQGDLLFSGATLRPGAGAYWRRGFGFFHAPIQDGA